MEKIMLVLKDAILKIYKGNRDIADIEYIYLG